MWGKWGSNNDYLLDLYVDYLTKGQYDYHELICTCAVSVLVCLDKSSLLYRGG